MKFTDGYWQLRPGLTRLRPAAVESVEATERSLVVYAPAKQIAGRGDTLNQPLFTVTLSSPAPDVIGVTIEHHSGGLPARPAFGLATGDDHPVKVEIDQETARLTSGDLTAVVRLEGPWNLRFERDGKALTDSSARSVGLITDQQGRQYLHEQLALGVGETVYGLGERFGPLVKNGQVVDIWNADGGTSSEQAYKNVPFYLSSAGYGVLVDTPAHVSFEVGSEVVSRNQFSVEGQQLTYFVIGGPEPKDVLRRYTALTGRPARVPAWSMGLWLSTSFTTDYTEETTSSFVEGMASRDLPLSVFHFDCFWMRQFHWCDFLWDPVAFPDRPGWCAG
ncbi:alpha-glucosidase (family GH31 glycosyl hydrolase) [Kribbella italica]|uniref:Alpha-glucosidase (Family GH31 glycosyl hydrolase) n=1 Tax=Kribbella italica TaxID=1540520 RepID=A0A7W9MZL8_9ACTN|nr:alpha-glucosidase (family GH31 glycosyl hydrolase) [Kribbella italica]